MVGPDYAFFTSLMCELAVAGMKDKYWECESKGKELEQWKARVRNPVDIIDRRTCVLGYRMVGLRSMQHSKFVLPRGPMQAWYGIRISNEGVAQKRNKNLLRC